MSPPWIYYHLWPVKGWQAVHQSIMVPLVESGLASAAAGITVGWADNSEPPVAEIAAGLPREPAIVNLQHGHSEMPTLAMLHDTACWLPADDSILYLHCRSAKRKPDEWGYQPALDHNAMMVYFLVERWREALAKLDQGYAVAGCNIQNQPRLHVSGNMWWAKAGALAELPHPDIGEEDRMEAEFWLGKGIARERMISLHRSPIWMNHYEHCYPRRHYAT